MSLVSKETIEELIQKVSGKMHGHATIILIGSAASIVGYDTKKNTHDVDTYNTLKKEFITAWDEACVELGISLSIGSSPVFTPPDGFEDRIHESDISTSKISVKYIDAYDFIISKIARGLEKDVEDINAIKRKVNIDAEKLIRLFFDEFLYVSAIGSHSMAIINLKDLIEHLFGREEYEKLIPLIDSLTRK